MNVKEAVERAKQEVTDLFADERAENIGLEEVEYDDRGKKWRITIGFSRPWNGEFGMMDIRTRSYKVVTMLENGKVLSVKNHATANA